MMSSVVIHLHLSICLLVYLSIHRSVYLSIYLSIYLLYVGVQMHICTSTVHVLDVYLETCTCMIVKPISATQPNEIVPRARSPELGQAEPVMSLFHHQVQCCSALFVVKWCQIKSHSMTVNGAVHANEPQQAKGNGAGSRRFDFTA